MAKTATGLARIQELVQGDLVLAAVRSDDGEGPAKLENALALSDAMQEIRSLCTDGVLDRVMPLQNTPLGFLTDKKEGYPRHVVRECFIEACLRGVRLVGNEFNIIGSKFYITQAGYQRKVAELPGLTNLRMEPGVPQMKDGGALVPYVATWLYRKRGHLIERLQTDKFDARIPVRVNAGMGTDAILGKAKRKMLAQVFAHSTGSAWVDDEPVEGEVELPEATESDPKKQQRLPGPAVGSGAAGS